MPAIIHGTLARSSSATPTDRRASDPWAARRDVLEDRGRGGQTPRCAARRSSCWGVLYGRTTNRPTMVRVAGDHRAMDRAAAPCTIGSRPGPRSNPPHRDEVRAALSDKGGGGFVGSLGGLGWCVAWSGCTGRDRMPSAGEPAKWELVGLAPHATHPVDGAARKGAVLLGEEPRWGWCSRFKDSHPLVDRLRHGVTRGDPRCSQARRGPPIQGWAAPSGAAGRRQ